MLRSHLASPAPQDHTAAACCLVAGRWVPGQVAAGRQSCPGLLHKQHDKICERSASSCTTSLGQVPGSWLMRKET